jgi:HTH-type transcriptional regulator, competence development regulator
VIDTINRVPYSARYMKTAFGTYIRKQREVLRESDRKYSLRQVAIRIGIEPSLLSRIERGETSSLSEQKIRALAKELEEDADVLLALSGKVSSDIQAVIRKRPQLFAQLIRDLKELPDQAVLRIVREVRDGKW